MSEASGAVVPIVLIVTLYVHPGQEKELRQFETAAAHIMRKHGGVIERVIRPDLAPNTTEIPHEIHVVTFPSTGAFAAYRSDPELAALASLRELAIARTEIIVGHDGEPYT
jgi:uncharacterized protein (DUF1330 family)